MGRQTLKVQGVAALGARRKMPRMFEVVCKKMGTINLLTTPWLSEVCQACTDATGLNPERSTTDGRQYSAA